MKDKEYSIFATRSLQGKIDFSQSTNTRSDVQTYLIIGKQYMDGLSEQIHVKKDEDTALK